MANINNLFTLMQQKGISASKLSANTGISTGNISDWKSGRSMPSADKLCIIADYLDCSIDFLLGRTEIIGVNNGYSYYPEEIAAFGAEGTKAKVFTSPKETT